MENEKPYTEPPSEDQPKYTNEKFNKMDNIHKIFIKKDDKSDHTMPIIQIESIISDPCSKSGKNSPDKKTALSEMEDVSTKDYSETRDENNMNQLDSNSIVEDVITNSSHLTIPSLNLNSLSSGKTMSSEKDSHQPDSAIPSHNSNSNAELVILSEDDELPDCKAQNIANVSLLHPISGDGSSISSSIHTHIGSIEFSQSIESSLAESNANQVCSTPLDKESTLHSHRLGISGLYVEESTDPPLQSNTDLEELEKDIAGKSGSLSSSTTSEDIIKLDIRGQAASKRNFPFSKIIYSNVESILNPVNRFVTMNTINFVENNELDLLEVRKEDNLSNSKKIPLKDASSNDSENISADDEDILCTGNEDFERDFDMEELIVNQSRDIYQNKDNTENDLFDAQSKPTLEGEFSMNTITTDYKTFPEDLHHKFPDIQKFLLQKIEELKLASEQRESLQVQNDYLSSELSKLRQILSEVSSSGVETKGQLSDFVKHENLINEGSLNYNNISGACLKSEETMDSDITQLFSPKETNDNSAGNKNILEVIIEKDSHSKLDPKIMRKKVFAHLEKEMLTFFDKSLADINHYIINFPEDEKKGDFKISFNEVLSHMKPDNLELIEFFKGVEQKHKKEVEKLRTYFEERCAKMEKNYSEDVFSQHSKKLSSSSSTDSLDNCPEALPFGSPLHGAGDKGFDIVHHKIKRSHSAEFHLGLDEITVLQKSLLTMNNEHQAQMQALKSQHKMDMVNMSESHELHFAEMEENYKNQIAELKAHLQTLENTDHGDLLHFEHRDADLELEKALLSDINATSSNWPLEFIGLKGKFQAEMQMTIENLKLAHAAELSAVQSENATQLAHITDKYKVEADKWKQKRNDAFDKNRKLEEVIKDRDGLRLMTATLRNVLTQLVEYFNLCEEELNNTFVGEFLRQIVNADDNFDNTIILSSIPPAKETDSQLGSVYGSGENLNISTFSQSSRQSKRLHFAPNVDGILPFIETESHLECIDTSQDVSVNFKHDLDYCLKRLKQEAQELLVLSSQTPKRLSILGPNDEQMPTKDFANTNELLQEEHNELQNKYEKSETIRRDLEESLSQSRYQEETLRGQLQEAFEKITELATEHPMHREIISERYGNVTPPARLAAELQAATTEREDMQMQVEQLESQIKDMTNRIVELQSEITIKQSELISSEEKIGLLQDIIGTLESQMETKTSQEIEVLKDLELYRLLAEEREQKIEDLTSELVASRNEIERRITESLLTANSKKRGGNTEGEMDPEKMQIEQMRSELQTLLKTLAEHTAALENLHEAVCSQSCSSPSEDVSIRDHKKQQSKSESSPVNVCGGRLPVLEVSQLGDGLQRHLKAEDAALKRIRDLEMQLIQLKDVAQELRMERDVLQERMSEQSFRMSSLQSRLEQTRHTVEAQSYHNTEGLRRQLDAAVAEGQQLREGLRTKDMQLRALESTPDSSKEIVQRLRRELEENKVKCRDLLKEVETLHNRQESLVADKNADIVILRQQLFEKEKHIQALLSLHIEDDRDKDCNIEGKLSARTLSDILSISEFDEPDLLVRNADIRPHSIVSGQYPFTNDNIKEQNATALPESGKIAAIAASSSGFANHSLKEPSLILQKDESLPLFHSILKEEKESNNLSDNLKRHQASALTSPRKHETVSSLHFKGLSENCSLFPNKDASGDKNVTIQPKKLDFSLCNFSEQNKIESCVVKKANLSLNDVDFYKDVDVHFINNRPTHQPKSFKELGIDVDTEQKLFPDILTQLKREIWLLREELNYKATALKMAEEQLSEFPIVKNGMEELERVLQNSLETMQEDKKYFNIQLENFAKGEQILKEQLDSASTEVKEKSKEINILKDDILRRETMISEIYKEKRSTEQKLAQVEERCKKFESDSMENHNLKKKLVELQKLEQTIAEKNLQIDSLNENLDRLDDLQKRVLDEEEKNRKLSNTLAERNADIVLLQKQNQDIQYGEQKSNIETSKLSEEIQHLTRHNTDLQGALSKYMEVISSIELDLENVIQPPTDDNQAELPADPTNQEVIKLEEYKLLLSGLEGTKLLAERIEDNMEYKYQGKLDNIKLKVQTLQNDLISKRRELSSKVLQLEQAKLEIGDLKMQIDYLKNDETDKDRMLKELVSERLTLRANLNILKNQLNEEGNVEEFRDKLDKRSEECEELRQVIVQLTENIKRHEANTVLSLERDRHLEDLLSDNEKLKLALGNVKRMLTDREFQLNNILSNMDNKPSAFLKDAQTSPISERNNSPDSNVIRILKDRLELANQSENRLLSDLENEKSFTAQLQKQIEKLKSREKVTSDESRSIFKQNQEKSDRLVNQMEDQELENLLRRNINENIQMSETVRELTQERRELQAKVKFLENQIKMGAKHSQSLINLPDGVDQQVRFLYGRYMRVDSYRKALVWQKRYLVGVANAGFLLQHWKNATNAPATNRFKCVTLSIIAVFRMKFLVRRWHTGNRIGANIHLNIPNVHPTELRNSKSYSHLPTTSYNTSHKEKSEVKTNHYFNDASAVNHSSKASNRSWTMGTKNNASKNQRDDQHCRNTRNHSRMEQLAFLNEDVPHKLKSNSSQPFIHSNRCQSTLDSHRLCDLHSDSISQPTSDFHYSSKILKSGTSPIVSQYLERIGQLDAKLQQALKSPRDPP